jgi:hypothetical protein
MNFIKASLKALIFSPQQSQFSLPLNYLNILKKFDSSLPFNELKESDFLGLMNGFSETTFDDVNKLSQLIIGDSL